MVSLQERFMPLSMPTYQISHPVQFSPRSAHSIKHTTAGLESTIQPRPKYGNLSEGARRSGSGAQATRRYAADHPPHAWSCSRVLHRHLTPPSPALASGHALACMTICSAQSHQVLSLCFVPSLSPICHATAHHMCMSSEVADNTEAYLEDKAGGLDKGVVVQVSA